MCGRYANTRSATDLSLLFEASDATGDERLAPNYNIAPTDPIHVIRESASRAERVVDVARWGLLPPWATERRAGARMINARVETVRSSPAFRTPFARRRCLVPADGWYEWQRPAGSGSAAQPGRAADNRPGRGAAGKQPYFLNPGDGEVLAFAGLWQPWGPDRLLTATILTTAAVGELAEVHDRMPVAIGPRDWAAWLHAGADLAERLVATPDPVWAARIERRPVGRQVGDVRNNSPELIRPVTASIPGVEPVDPVDLTLF